MDTKNVVCKEKLPVCKKKTSLLQVNLLIRAKSKFNFKQQ